MKRFPAYVLSDAGRRLLPLACAAGAVTALALPAAANASVTQNYACTNSTQPQIATAPAGAVAATVTIIGSAGENGTNGAVGGTGESMLFSMPVTASQQFDVLVGCQNGDPQNPLNGGNGAGTPAPSGGGASQLSPQGDDSLADVYAIAGAGGGAGGAGGGTSGGNGGAAAGPGNANGAPGTAGTGTISSPPENGGDGGTGGGAGGFGGAGGTGDVPGSDGHDGFTLRGGGGGSGANTLGTEGGSGGGGGSGFMPGGGGGGGASDGFAEAGGGGGGGGGNSFLAAGVTGIENSPGDPSTNGSVTITYTIIGSITAPATQSFGQVPTNTSQAETITFTNTGSGVDDPGTLGSPTISQAASAYSVTGGTCTAGGTLANGQSCTVQVTLDAATSGDQPATLNLATNSATTANVAVQLDGTALTPANIVVRPGASDLGDVATGQSASKTITVSNLGQEPLDVDQVSLTGSPEFSIVADQDFCSAWSLSPQSNCTVQIAYTPTATGARTATLSVPSDASNNADVTVALSATGTAAVPGSAGAPGTDGATGATGAAGTGGTKGTDGKTGVTGATGTTGATGATGAQGPTGAAGTSVYSLALSSRRLDISAPAATHVTLQFKLAHAGKVKVTLEREVKGISWRRVGSETVRSPTGPNSLIVGDSFAGHRLTTGRYRVVLQLKLGTTWSSPVGRVFTAATA
jgi:hypothetical protein